MKIDLLLVPMGVRFADLREAALTAEEAGFDGIWAWDHLRDPIGGGGTIVPPAPGTLPRLGGGAPRGRTGLPTALCPAVSSWQ